MSNKKEIVVGTYQHGREHPQYGHYYSNIGIGGTNNWDYLIQQHNYDNVKFEVVLREKEES